MLLSGNRVSSLDEPRFLDEEIANREVDCVPTTFDTDAEHVVVDEVPIEDELYGLRPAE